MFAAARSWNQTFTFIEDDIAVHQDVPGQEIPGALGQIRFNSGIIQRFQGFIQQDLEAIRDSPWNTICLIDANKAGQAFRDKLLEEQDTTLAELTRDYESLLAHCILLSQRCESASVLLQSSIALLGSQKSIQQTEEVNKLTKLAFIFVPVSLVSSIFGMNISEISPGTTTRWWHFLLTCFLVLIPCVFLSLGDRSKRWFHMLLVRINWLKLKVQPSAGVAP